MPANVQGWHCSRSRFLLITFLASQTALPEQSVDALKPHLLDDEAVRRFICEGFVRVKTQLSADFHAKIFKKVYKMHAAGTQVGNNILPAISELHKVLNDRHVVGALQSVLGEDYYLHPHRHVHETFPGKNQQPLHQDSYFDYQQAHHHHPQWAMAMYYPQNVSVSLGPTRIIPGAHFFGDSGVLELVNGKRHYQELTVDAGDVVIIHYNTWHWAGPNLLGTQIPGTEFANQVVVKRSMGIALDPDIAKYRYMFKFQFMRMRQPGMRAPSWAHDSSRAMPPWECSLGKAGLALAPVWEASWNWMLGGRSIATADFASSSQASSDPKLTKLIKTFTKRPKSFERKAKQLVAAYELAKSGASGVEALMSALSQDSNQKGSKVAGDEFLAISAANALSATGFNAVVPLVAAARKVLKQVNQTLAEQQGLRHVCFVLGEILSTGPLNISGTASLAESLHAIGSDSSVRADAAEWNSSAACPADADPETALGCRMQDADVLPQALDILFKVALSSSADALARRNAIEALGMIGARLVDDLATAHETEQARLTSAVESIVQSLHRMLEAPHVLPADDFDFLPSVPNHRLASDQRRFMAAIALAQLRDSAASATEVLAKFARDPASTRYMRSYALEALRRGNTSEAFSAILSVLETEPSRKGSKSPPKDATKEKLQEVVTSLLKKRWCPLSNGSSPY